MGIKCNRPFILKLNLHGNKRWAKDLYEFGKYEAKNSASLRLRRPGFVAGLAHCLKPVRWAHTAPILSSNRAHLTGFSLQAVQSRLYFAKHKHENSHHLLGIVERGGACGRVWGRAHAKGKPTAHTHCVTRTIGHVAGRNRCAHHCNAGGHRHCAKTHRLAHYESAASYPDPHRCTHTHPVAHRDV